MKSKTLGQKIAELRKAKRYTQAELAEKLGVSSQAVSKWENDVAYPDITLLSPLAELLGSTVDQLLNGKAEPVTQYVAEKERKNYEDLIFKIRILDGKTKVNVNLPLPLLEVFKDTPDVMFQGEGNGAMAMVSKIDFNKLIELAEKGVLGKLIEIEGDDGETVEVFVE